MKKNVIRGVNLGLALVFCLTIVYTMNSSSNAKAYVNQSSKVEGEAPSYSVNKNGQTYGHGPYPAGEAQEPDLIRAQGENGVVGYIKSSDISSSYSSPEEAIAHQKEVESVGYQSIPLYESDGTTIIGEFKLYNSNID
ncbi:hypothetical protein [Paenibacillus sp. GCM10027626]|uniref:hypothetical protein n=1 Tax=Paenibacillus sp. GCM10027626 TaxID=3273411 RepID=UPI00362E32C2